MNMLLKNILWANSILVQPYGLSQAMLTDVIYQGIESVTLHEGEEISDGVKFKFHHDAGSLS